MKNREVMNQSNCFETIMATDESGKWVNKSFLKEIEMLCWLLHLISLLEVSYGTE